MGAGDEGGTEELGADDRRVEGKGGRQKGAGKGNKTTAGQHPRLGQERCSGRCVIAYRQHMYVYACLQGKYIAWGLTCPKNMRSDAARSWKVTAPLKPDALLGHSRHAKQLRVHARAQVFWQWHRATSRRYPSARKAV